MISRYAATAALLGLVLGGCSAPGMFRQGAGDAPSSDAAGRYAQALARQEQAPDDIENGKNLARDGAQAALDLLQRVRGKMAAGDEAGAQAELSALLAVQPGNMRARQLQAQLERRLLLKRDLAEAGKRQADHPAEALDIVNRILQEQPDYEPARALRATLMRAQAQRASARPKLADALRKPVSLNFKSQPVVQILEAISKIAGVDFVLDPEVASSAPATIIADQTTAEDAINLLLRTSKLEKKVLSERSLLIYPASAEKSKEYRELMVRVFYLSNAQAAKVVPALRQVGTIKNVHLDERANALIVRDTPEVIAVAERIVAALDLAQSEVTMDVRVLEVNTNDELEVGVDYPSDLRLSILPQGESGKVTVGDILGLNSEMLGVSSRNELSMALNLLQKRGKTRVLANPKIRVRNMEKASIKIGEKVPVVTTTNANGVVTESVNYQDVGLSLQVEPQVTLGNDVSVKVSMEVSNLKGEVKTAGGGVVYPMSTRNAETVMTARDGETQVLAGLVNQKQSGNTSGLPGLSTLEWLGSLFGSTKDSEESTEIVLLLTPHVERSLELPAASNSYFPSGTEASVTVLPLTTAPARPGLDAPLARPY
ncbi:secretin N-terminal domain-containing protein [Achromobacter sp. AONIH1]|uniref:secretin N-terminal domain-containing protein n=1 Tax=Achromobacter sp. AONIH1 TaxID=1758194 RepID=UPI00131A068C|nr:secretin N-terminal domain-containing protein [Achromobacter sp. AONIH1]